MPNPRDRRMNKLMRSISSITALPSSSSSNGGDPSADGNESKSPKDRENEMLDERLNVGKKRVLQEHFMFHCAS